MRHRVGPALFVVAIVAAVSVSFADSKPGKSRHAKPKPVDSVADAGVAAEAPGATAGTGGDGGAPALAPPVAPAVSFFDGGVRASPLNPNPAEFPGDVTPPAGAPSVDYDKLLGDIVALRARVAAVGDTLFQSRLAVSIRTSGDRAHIDRLVVSLDDGPVFTSASTFRADDGTNVYEHAVSPGKHAVTVDVERKDDHDESFRSAQRSRFVVDVPRDNRLEFEVRIDDDSTMGANFPGSRSGHYDLRIRAKATARPVKR